MKKFLYLLAFFSFPCFAATLPATSNYYYQVPLTAFSITIPNWANILQLNPAGTLAAGTITMPAAPIDGEVVTLTSTQTITTLTQSANTSQTLNSALTTFPGGTSAQWQWNASLATWLFLGTLQDSANTQATQTVSYQPGLLTAVNATKGVYGKFVKASTVDNIVGSAVTFSCVSNPTVTLTNCHADATCGTAPTTIGTVTITASGQAFDGSISAGSILAGEYVAWSMTAGTCASVDLSATAQVHSN